MGIYAEGGYEVGVRKGAVMGMRPWGYMQEEVRRREGGRRRRRWDFHLKSNNPSLRGGEKTRRNPSKSAPVVEKFNFSIGFYPQGVCIIRVWPLEPNSEKSKKRLPDGSPKDPKKIPKRSQKEPQMIPKRPQNDPQTIPSGSQAIPREPQSLPKCPLKPP